MRIRAKLRSDGVVRFHEANASAATASARSMSAAPETGASANASPVLGSTKRACGPSDASWYCPPTKFCNLRTSLPPLPVDPPPTESQ